MLWGIIETNLYPLLGQQYTATFTVTNLPPLTLICVLTDEYPTIAPNFTLSTSWLSGDEMQAIAKCLNDIAMENCGACLCVLYI